jgi:hypothetical protein
MKVAKRVFLLSIIAAGLAADKKEAHFSPGPASSYAIKQTNEKVTIAVKVYDTEDLSKTAFGKVNPYMHGVLPMLVVIQNDSGKSLRLDGIQVNYVGPDRSKIENIPALEVKYVGANNRPRLSQSPLPTGIPRGGPKKGPLNAVEIETRAFAAKMLAPGDSASGFFYFQTGHRRGSKFYLTGITEAISGKEIFYFDIPLD